MFSKKLLILFSVVLVSCTVGSAFGTVITWTNAAADQDWNNPVNWGGTGPLTGDIALLGSAWGAGASGTNQPIVSSPAPGVPFQIGLGWPNGGVAEMTVADGGSLTADNMYLGWGQPGGVLHMEGGLLNVNAQISVGGNAGGSTGLIDMTGGVIDTPVMFIDNGGLSVSGQVNLAGGTIYTTLSVGVNGVMDISGSGTLVWEGIDMAGLTGMSSWGAGATPWITADGGNETFIAVYDAGTNATTVTVTPEPATMLLLGLGGLLIRRRRA